MQSFDSQTGASPNTVSMTSTDSLSLHTALNGQFDSPVMTSLSRSTQSEPGWNAPEVSLMENVPLAPQDLSSLGIPREDPYSDEISNRRRNHSLISEYEHRIFVMEGDMQRLILENEKLKNQVRSLESILEDQLYKNKTTPAPTSLPSNEMPKRKSGRYWSIEEHGKFVEALEKFGTRDIKTISAYVGTRTPTQVRTHLQKFLLRLRNENNKHRKENLYTLGSDVETDHNHPSQNASNSPLPTDIVIPVVGSNCQPSIDMDLPNLSTKKDLFEDRQKPNESCLSISLPTLTTPPETDLDVFRPKQFPNYDQDPHRPVGVSSLYSSVLPTNQQQHYLYHSGQFMDTSILRKVYSVPNGSAPAPNSGSLSKPVFPLLPQSQSQQLAC